MTSFWQEMVLTDGELDKVAGLILSGTKGIGAIARQSLEGVGERPSSVLSI